MGFGILFFGYFLTFGFSFLSFGDIAAVVGCVFMLFACLKLSEYNRYFNGMTVAVMVLTLLSLGGVMASVFHLPLEGLLSTLTEGGKLIAACVLHCFLFLGTRGISLGAECTKLVKGAERDLVMSVTYYTVSLVLLLTGGFFPDVATVIRLWLRLYWLVCFVLNMVLIYKAFGLLYPADEDPNGRKRSRFRIINFMEDKMDAFEENKKKYRMESMQMALNEAARAKKERDEKRSGNAHFKKKKKK